MSGMLREVTWLSQAAAQANDQALAKVVGMLDGMKDRGEADQVLAMVRQRLRAQRPARPLGFARLLFMPLDGAIVPTPRWKRGEASLPRGVLAPLAAALHRNLGDAAVSLSNACEGRTTADHQAVALVGAKLWPQVAQLLDDKPPPGWAESGVPPAEYLGIAALCRALWLHGPLLWAAMAKGAEGPPEPLALAALQAVAPAGPQAVQAAMASLLLRAANPGSLAALAARVEPQCRGAALAAVDRMLDAPVPQLDLLDLGAAAETAATMLRKLDDLAESSLVQGDRQLKLAAHRRAVDEACRERFLAGAEAALVAPAGRLLAAAQVTDAEVDALEAGARQLRNLQSAGRRLGNAPAYDRALAGLSDAMTQLAPAASGGAGLRRMDLARTVEILCGAEAALRVLQAEA